LTKKAGKVIYKTKRQRKYTMKAVRLVEIGKPLQMQDIPIPKLDENDVLVEIKAAGICHSDVHYRAGTSPVGPLPQTLGHEIAGIIREKGSEVKNLKVGDRVCIHYLLSCGRCYFCAKGNEQFCKEGMMIGKHCDGGFAEYIAVPSRNVFPLPPEISFEEGAILMCSSSTSLHALHKAKLKPGESVAIFGAGGLGISAIQLAKAFGAIEVYAVDIDEYKLKIAEKYGAFPINSKKEDPVDKIYRLTGGKGADVALELVGLPEAMKQAVRSLAIFGRAVLVGITDRSFEIYPYKEIINKEAEIIGCSDRLLQELPLLIELTRRKKLDLSQVITEKIPLEADAINKAMDRMEKFDGGIRTVILP